MILAYTDIAAANINTNGRIIGINKPIMYSNGMIANIYKHIVRA